MPNLPKARLKSASAMGLSKAATPASVSIPRLPKAANKPGMGAAMKAGKASAPKGSAGGLMSKVLGGAGKGASAGIAGKFANKVTQPRQSPDAMYNRAMKKLSRGKG